MRPLGSYSFLPWLRSGLAGHIDGSAGARATIEVELEVVGDPVEGDADLKAGVKRDVALYGPGDVIGIDPRAVVRTEPRDWITNYEPNYLAHVEFYDEDFPWRYTPATPEGHRLRPWIALVVLEEDEFDDFMVPGQPLPGITVSGGLPNPDELWAWAHVHVNAPLADPLVSTDAASVAQRLRSALAANRDIAYSRIVCPRRLAPDTAYHAFVVPVFESGRRAGLGEEGAAPAATAFAWQAGGAAKLPVYHRWYFRTGAAGDFEYLVRLLEPGIADRRVGVRDMDVRTPGARLPGIDDADLGGILKLGGALRFPLSSYTPQERAAFDRYDKWSERPPAPRDYPQPFQQRLARFVNLPEDYRAAPAQAANAAAGLGVQAGGHPDPLITAPLYGRWHALTQRLLYEADGSAVERDGNWVHDLNLDPRHRVAAGFGTRVVQTNQENYMEAAWEQVGDVLAANRRIRLAQLALLTATSWHEKQLAGRDPARVLSLVAPASGHVLVDGATVRHRMAGSLVDPALTSVALRRIARPGGRLMRGLAFTTRAAADRLLERVDSGEISPAPPKRTPPGVVTVDHVAEATGTPAPTESDSGPPGWLVRLLLLIAAILGCLARLLRAVGLRSLARALRRLADRLIALARPPEPASPLGEAALAPEAIARLPARTEDERRFKRALVDWGRLHEASRKTAEEAPVRRLGIEEVVRSALAKLDPYVTVPRRTMHAIRLPRHLIDGMVEDFGEVMHYPRLDTPMYEPLRDISDELFLPNLNLLKPNSITLLETNQRFIEAYMVGLNHEFGRELLWREYPTDQRGSYFRQFWDAAGMLDTERLDPDALREKLYDIPELHRWPRASDLGDHDHRERAGDDEEEAVLVIRGELLKKYPNAVIYAHRAKWHRRADGTFDTTKERELAPLTEAEEADPPRAKVRTPLYEARVFPDITFFGFDLTVPEAKGDDGDHPTEDNAGWFFCIKERPGEPRFGFDIDKAPQVQTVNDIAWPDAGTAEGGFLAPGALAPLTLAALGADDQEKKPQRDEDVVAVTAEVSSARWAYLLYQAPVLVAVHAKEMLP